MTDDNTPIGGGVQDGIPDALLDPQTRQKFRQLLDRIEESEDDIEDLTDRAEVASTERDQNREMARDARDVAGYNESRIEALKTQLHYGKGRRKKILLNAVEARADARDDGRGRLLVKEAVEELKPYKRISPRSARNYFAEMDDEYEGVEYRQTTEPKYRGRNIKALYLHYNYFWSNHDADDLL